MKNRRESSLTLPPFVKLSATASHQTFILCLLLLLLSLLQVHAFIMPISRFPRVQQQPTADNHLSSPKPASPLLTSKEMAGTIRIFGGLFGQDEDTFDVESDPNDQSKPVQDDSFFKLPKFLQRNRESSAGASNDSIDVFSSDFRYDEYYSATTNKDSSLLINSNSQNGWKWNKDKAGKNKKKNKQNIPTPSDSMEWLIYVDQSQASLEKGGLATLDAFLGLTNPQKVQVLPALLQPVPATNAVSNASKQRKSGPLVQCVQQGVDDDDATSAFEIYNVDSVDKVYRVLTHHLHIPTDRFMLNALKWKYKGNEHLENDKIDMAIDAYYRGIGELRGTTKAEQLVAKGNSKYGPATTDGKQSSSSAASPPPSINAKAQEGILLLLRGTAYLQQALNHKKELQEIVDQLLEERQQQKSAPSKRDKIKQEDPAKNKNNNNNNATDPEFPSMQIQKPSRKKGSKSFWDSPSITPTMLQYAITHPEISTSLLNPMTEEQRGSAASFKSLAKQTRYRQGLVQYSLLHAAQDALQATELLPHYATTWLRAADVLAELWKLDESQEYYQLALNNDPSLGPTVKGILQQLQEKRSFLKHAQSQGWSSDIAATRTTSPLDVQSL